jgi:hypothetical protein
MNIQENIFDLTEEQILTSKRIYNGKVIKCLVAPYHTYNQLENIIPYSKTTYLFPEREISNKETLNFVSLIVNNQSTSDVVIITTNLNIILDMIDDCVRILTEDELIVASPCKTYMANIHNIKYNLLENESYQKTQKVKNLAVLKINDIIQKINDIKETNKITQKEIDNLLIDINLIGEPVLVTKLRQMISDRKRYIISDKINIEDVIEEIASKCKKPEEYKYHAKEIVRLYRDMNLTDDEIIQKLKK